MHNHTHFCSSCWSGLRSSLASFELRCCYMPHECLQPGLASTDAAFTHHGGSPTGGSLLKDSRWTSKNTFVHAPKQMASRSIGVQQHQEYSLRSKIAVPAPTSKHHFLWQSLYGNSIFLLLIKSLCNGEECRAKHAATKTEGKGYFFLSSHLLELNINGVEMS